jgi:RHS repeat-associated protein
VVSSHRYLPFGEEIEPEPTATIFQDDFESSDISRWDGVVGTKRLKNGPIEVIKFTGHERDLRSPEANDDLDYMHARYYNPYLGRFLSVDPVGGTVGVSQSWNRYSYVYNNPLKSIDPNGEAVLAAIGAYLARVGVGAVSGGLTNVGYSCAKEMIISRKPPTISNVISTARETGPGAFVRGAIVGGVNGGSPPGISLATTSVAAGTIEYIDSKNTGYSKKESAERGAVKGLGTLVGNAVTLLDVSATAGSAVSVLAGEVASDAVYGLGVEYPEQMKQPEGSDEQIKDRREQTRELLEQEELQNREKE